MSEMGGGYISPEFQEGNKEFFNQAPCPAEGGEGGVQTGFVTLLNGDGMVLEVAIDDMNIRVGYATECQLLDPMNKLAEGKVPTESAGEVVVPPVNCLRCRRCVVARYQQVSALPQPQ